MKMIWNWRWPKKKKMLYSRQSLALAYMTLVVIVFTSFVAHSWRYMRILYCLFTSVAQKINSVPNTYSNIFVKKLRISNIFVTRQLTKYEYRIYSFLASCRIRISNRFILSNMDKYEYRIYLKQDKWIFVLEYIIFSAFYLNLLSTPTPMKFLFK